MNNCTGAAFLWSVKEMQLWLHLAPCHYTYTPLPVGWGRYEEGPVALMSVGALVCDDELVAAPVLVAVVREVAADDDGDLPAPVREPKK